jgi:hypothetical protein
MIKHMKYRTGPFLFAGVLLLAALSTTAASQQARADSLVSATVKSMLVRYRDAFFVDTATLIPPPSFSSRADSLAWVTARDLAARAGDEYRVVVSIFDRQLQVIRGVDTLLVAPIAVASGITLEYAGRAWTFRTPRGQRRVLRKVEDPVWRPPDWLYAEVASEYGLKLERLQEGSSINLEDGRRLTVRNGIVGLSQRGSSAFTPLPIDEHIVFNSTLFIPPAGTWNRKVEGELGPYALDLGSGYLLHGTPDQTSIGRAVTHGCIRLADPDITWLYENVPVGTPVYIY